MEKSYMYIYIGLRIHVGQDGWLLLVFLFVQDLNIAKETKAPRLDKITTFIHVSYSVK